MFEFYKKQIREIYGKDNTCPHYNECRKNVKYSGCSKIIDKFIFDRARIGELYGTEENVPKIVMVGIEGFPKEKIVTDVIPPAFTDDAINPHYNGVKYILAYLLADFLNKDKPQPKITKKGTLWVNDALKRYTLCNLYKCAFVPENEPDKEKGLCHTKAMSSNCINLLIKELKILEPDIVVIQSSDYGVFKETMRAELHQHFNCKKILDIQGSRANLYQGIIKTKPIVFIQTMHGSFGGFKSHDYIENCLNPILDKAIEIYESTN
jgi:hypothetical protein